MLEQGFSVSKWPPYDGVLIWFDDERVGKPVINFIIV